MKKSPTASPWPPARAARWNTRWPSSETRPRRARPAQKSTARGTEPPLSDEQAGHTRKGMENRRLTVCQLKQHRPGQSAVRAEGPRFWPTGLACAASVTDQRPGGLKAPHARPHALHVISGHRRRFSVGSGRLRPTGAALKRPNGPGRRSPFPTTARRQGQAARGAAVELGDASPDLFAVARGRSRRGRR